MRYFTRELWAGVNRNRVSEARGAAEQWRANAKRYFAQLNRIRPMLSEREARFFTKESLHDGTLLRLTLGDDIGPTGMPRKATRLILLVRDGAGRFDHELRYDGLTEVNMHSDTSMFPMGKSIFGQWGYDELLRERKGLLRHNILFSCGTELWIVFERVRYRRHRAKVRR